MSDSGIIGDLLEDEPDDRAFLVLSSLTSIGRQRRQIAKSIFLSRGFSEHLWRDTASAGEGLRSSILTEIQLAQEAATAVLKDLYGRRVL